jgi:hypothetical protein
VARYETWRHTYVHILRWRYKGGVGLDSSIYQILGSALVEALSDRIYVCEYVLIYLGETDFILRVFTLVQHDNVVDWAIEQKHVSGHSATGFTNNRIQPRSIAHLDS